MGRKKVSHCKRGHDQSGENRTKDGKCKKCHSILLKLRIENNPELKEKRRQANLLQSAKKSAELAEFRKLNPVVPKSHCINGHKRSPENISKNGACKICQKLRSESSSVVERCKLRQNQRVTFLAESYIKAQLRFQGVALDFNDSLGKKIIDLKRYSMLLERSRRENKRDKESTC